MEGPGGDMAPSTKAATSIPLPSLDFLFPYHTSPAPSPCSLGSPPKRFIYTQVLSKTLLSQEYSYN